MNSTHYLDLFQKAAGQLDKKLLSKKQIEVAVGMYKDAVFLKLYKTAWANKLPDPLSAESRIFFSIWINDPTLSEQKLFYNIHALKLRKLSGYSITSRDFATAFRKSFKKFEDQWPNVSVDFGPLTLMQGWIKEGADIQHETLRLSDKFLKIDHLVDDLLDHYKLTGTNQKK